LRGGRRGYEHIAAFWENEGGQPTIKIQPHKKGWEIKKGVEEGTRKFIKM